jgi:hypothetical protein
MRILHAALSLLLLTSPFPAAEPKVQRDLAYVEPKTEGPAI